MRLTVPSVRLLTGFDDPSFLPTCWGAVQQRGDTNVVFLTYAWQRAWWEVFGRGQLLLLRAESSEGATTLAPLFIDSGMVFFVGSGGSDYLDFVGDGADDEAVLPVLLDAARTAVPGFLGFRFFHVPNSSRTGARLRAAANRLGLSCVDEGSMPAPMLDLRNPGTALAAVNKKSLRRHENGLHRRGVLTVQHVRSGDAIRQHLPAFFGQHVARWESTAYPSLFLNRSHRTFYERLTMASDIRWLRFTRLDLDERPVAFHFGTFYGNTFLWYKPSFDVALAKQSPGEVLLRKLLLAANEEGAHTFDFGLGDEPFKQRFATHNPRVRTWELYPRQVR
jgi:CelD/BcsL family acetyltransferase involved in cellulose biosynthesis